MSLDARLPELPQQVRSFSPRRRHHGESLVRIAPDEFFDDRSPPNTVTVENEAQSIVMNKVYNVPAHRPTTICAYRRGLRQQSRRCGWRPLFKRDTLAVQMERESQEQPSIRSWSVW